MNQKNRLPTVSVVIPAFNEERYIGHTLEKLLQSSYPSELLEIIVVDNNSADSTVRLARQYTDLVFVLPEGNVGAVRNLGATKAKGDVLAFLDADCAVSPDWLLRGVNELASKPGSVLGGPCKTRPQPNWVEQFWLLENPRHPRIQKDLLGSCIFTYKSSFWAVGGFDETMTSGEDSDLSSRLRENGFKVQVIGDLSVVHLGNPTTISDFVKRQIWHSENYLQFLKASAKDPTFWLVITYLFSFTLITVFAFLGFFTLAASFLVTLLGTVIITSLKRMFVTRFLTLNVLDILKILALDTLYLSARSIGIVKSAFTPINKTKIHNNIS